MSAPTHEEKFNLLMDYFSALDAGFAEKDLGELMMIVKSLIIHISSRAALTPPELMAALQLSYDTDVAQHRNKDLEEMKSMVIDELARQEERHDS